MTDGPNEPPGPHGFWYQEPKAEPPTPRRVTPTPIDENGKIIVHVTLRPRSEWPQ